MTRKDFDEWLRSIPAGTLNNFWYRGEIADPTWQLMPRLGRVDVSEEKGKDENERRSSAESRLYLDFRDLGASLLAGNDNPWSIAHLMQHHGLPTRLLDWTTDLGVALYFAAISATEQHPPVIWILEPYELNDEMGHHMSIPSMDVPGKSLDYYSHYVSSDPKKLELESPALAISYRLIAPRMVAQSSRFTVHGDLKRGLEEYPNNTRYLKRATLPKDLIKIALQYCSTIGKNSWVFSQ